MEFLGLGFWLDPENYPLQIVETGIFGAGFFLGGGFLCLRKRLRVACGANACLKGIMQTLLPIATEIGAILKARRETIAIAESSSGGLISAALLAVPGASAYYRGGGVIYSPKAFGGLLGLDRSAMEGLRSSTEPYALLLAQTIQSNLNATWGLSETGAAGPSGNGYGDAAGHTCVGLISKDGTVSQSRTLETGLADREANMRHFALEALDLLHQALVHSDA